MLNVFPEGSDVSEAQLINTMFQYKAWADAELPMTMKRFDAQALATERPTAIRPADADGWNAVRWRA